MQIQMRSLKTKDIFPMSRILKKIGLKEIMKEAAANAAKPSDGEEITKREVQMRTGAEIFAAVFENLPQAEEETNALLASLCGMTPEQFAELDFETILSVLDAFKNQKGIANFLKLASQ